tara:strand:+ start:2498 stop:2782 length:285 start_codon:yes stop_codon:yes gene_type:complete
LVVSLFSCANGGVPLLLQILLDHGDKGTAQAKKMGLELFSRPPLSGRLVTPVFLQTMFGFQILDNTLMLFRVEGKVTLLDFKLAEQTFLQGVFL